MSDDELYNFCRDMARDLVVHFHPDRHGTNAVATTFQRRFSEAFDLLKNRDVFNAALSEFKRQKGELQSEHSELRELATIFRQMAEENRDKLAAAEAALKQANAVIKDTASRYLNLLRLRGAEISFARTEDPPLASVGQVSKLIVLEFDFTPTPLPSPEKIAGLQERYERNSRTNWTTYERESFSGDLNRYQIGSVPPEPLFQTALQSETMFPEVNWTENDRYRELGFARFLRPPREKKAFAYRELGALCPERELSRRYKEALQLVRQLVCERTSGVSDLYVRLVRLPADNGILSLGRYRYPILGSISLADINPRQFKVGAPKQLKAVDPGYDLPEQSLLRHLYPLVLRGAMLVLQTNKMLRASVSARPEEVYERAKRLRPVNTTHVILEIQ